VPEIVLIFELDPPRPIRPTNPRKPLPLADFGVPPVVFGCRAKLVVDADAGGDFGKPWATAVRFDILLSLRFWSKSP
jgi:hypothetical protein